MFKLCKQFAFATMAMVCLSILTATLAQADDSPNVQPPARSSSWGAIKQLYNPMPTAEVTQALKGKATSTASYGGDWSNNIISEAFYSLNRGRTGSSNVVYQGKALSDWAYVASDPGALSTMTAYIGGPVYRGSVDGTWNGGSRGGYCKFFVDLILFRSSYGIGGGNHLVLPGGTYDYRGYMPAYGVQQATRGMVVQRGGSSPHSAIVIANLGWGLDLIDSNFTGGDGQFVISRHALDWNQLAGYTAYKATYMRQF